MRIETTDIAIYYMHGNGPFGVTYETVSKVNHEEVRDGVLTLRYIDEYRRTKHLGSWPLTALRKWHRIGSAT